MSDRLEIIDERLDHYSERIDRLEDALSERKGHTLELIVIVLIVVEILEGAWMFFHHA